MAVTVTKHTDGTFSIKNVTADQLEGIAVLLGCANSRPYDVFEVFAKVDDVVEEFKPNYGSEFRGITIDLTQMSKGE